MFLKVVCHYDSSILSMSVLDFPKKVWMGGGWGELYPIFCGFFNFAKHITLDHCQFIVSL